MFDRIECNQEVLSGKPCIKGTRLSVQFILELIASGGTPEAIVQQYPFIDVEDVKQAVQYAARLASRDRYFEHEVAI